MTREKPLTRFHEKNSHPQCKHCNNEGKGEQALHGRYIDERYGAGTAGMLLDMSRMRGQKVHDDAALALIAGEYRLKARELAHQKGLEIPR